MMKSRDCGVEGMHALIWKMIVNFTRCCDPEFLHKLALAWLSMESKTISISIDPVLHQKVAGITFPNFLGTAAGLDKNAEAMPAFFNMGFGFLEVGAVTPLPQEGNPKPRIFRLPEDGGIINRLGFNNDGLSLILPRLQNKPSGVVGVNIGCNKNSHVIEDYRCLLHAFDQVTDYITINISSPNTDGLRDNQKKENIKNFLDGVFFKWLGRTPVFLKLSPDLPERDIDCLLNVINEFPISALVISNTTVSRNYLYSENQKELGGLSGRPLFEKSTALLRSIYKKTSLPLIGVGGVEDAITCYKKIKSGAQLIQLYTVLAYKGPLCVLEILNGVKALLQQDGFSHISDVVGIDVK